MLTKLQNITNTPANQSLSVGDIVVATNILQRVANVSRNQTVNINDLYVSQIKDYKKTSLMTVDIAYQLSSLISWKLIE